VPIAGKHIWERAPEVSSWRPPWRRKGSAGGLPAFFRGKNAVGLGMAIAMAGRMRRAAEEPVRDHAGMRPDAAVLAGAAHFHRLPRPTRNDLDDLARRVSLRAERWLRRKRLLCDDDQALCNNETRELEPLDARLEGSLGIGKLAYLPDATDRGGSDELGGLPVPSKSERRGGHHRGFDVHAGVVVSRSDREGRERLLRYCPRPPLSLERLSVTKEGLVAYR
jgi:hypothetical protein